eukprot:5963510-Pleurochrysis_carterae.AAC.3
MARVPRAPVAGHFVSHATQSKATRLSAKPRSLSRRVAPQTAGRLCKLSHCSMWLQLKLFNVTPMAYPVLRDTRRGKPAGVQENSRQARHLVAF